LLTYLKISGLAIISELSISFQEGFNVITGETGAGKSILIKALNLLMGQKAQADAVRQGYEQASVVGSFRVQDSHRVLAMLDGKGIGFEVENGEVQVIIRRQITAKGRSQAWVNDTPVAAQTLKDIGSTLIDVFAQHQSHKIFEAHRHLKIVDQFIKDTSILEKVRSLYKSCIADVKSIADLVSQFAAHQRDEDYLRYRYGELFEFSPSSEDFEEFSEICHRAEKSEAIKQNLNDLYRMFEHGVNGKGINTLLWSMTNPLKKILKVDSSFREIFEDLQEMASRCDDLSFKIGKVMGQHTESEEDLETAQSRLAKYQELFRKFSVGNPDDLLNEMAVLKHQIDLIQNAAEEVETRFDSLQKKVVELGKFTKSLSQERSLAAKMIKKRVEVELKDLGMAHAQFGVEFTDVQNSLPDLNIGVFSQSQLLDKWGVIAEALSSHSEWGDEKAEFFLAANPGETSLPLVRVASGGEVSRIMLALKKSLLAGASACILVFDEIDSGISGRIANKVGQKMKELSKSFQLICISHLPQVAAFADCHFCVEKYGKGKRTESTIRALDKDQSIHELARLLSGDQVSDTSIEHAKLLIKNACDEGVSS
jgi:DNA repair protein RecN (Recombination protein N)